MSRRRAKSKLLPAYFAWRDGRPRWVPGPALRRAGHKGRDLKDAGGQWLGLEAAIAAARKLNADVAEARRTGSMPAPQPKTRKPARTCRHLYEMWAAPHDETQASPRWQKLAPATRADYRNKAALFLAEFGDLPVAAVAKSDLHTWWEELYRERGHAMANGTLAVARALFSYGEMKGWRDTNPAKKLEIERLPPRIVTHTPGEIEAQIAAAYALGLPGIADAITIALHTGQRQGDVRVLEHEGASDGRAMFRISKTGARVSVPFTPQLSACIDAITARRRTGPTPELKPMGALVRDAKGRPYNDRFAFGRDYRAVRAHAVKMTGLSALASKQFWDLRDTAITRLALAGCSVPEIASITKHEMKTIHDVLKHYVDLSPQMADAAIARLVAYMDREGIRV